MDSGPAEEAGVAIKLSADEDAVTYLRLKLGDRDTDVKGEGWNAKAITELIENLQHGLRAEMLERMEVE